MTMKTRLLGVANPSEGKAVLVYRFSPGVVAVPEEQARFSTNGYHPGFSFRGSDYCYLAENAMMSDIGPTILYREINIG